MSCLSLRPLRFKMKHYIFFVFTFFVIFTNAQNITVDSQTYTPQQLIENILIDSDCINNITVTNVVGGDFGGTDQSYGYFDATGTTFPFQSGLVLSTGRLANVPGPNNSLSDDDAPNAVMDTDNGKAANESEDEVEFIGASKPDNNGQFAEYQRRQQQRHRRKRKSSIGNQNGSNHEATHPAGTQNGGASNQQQVHGSIHNLSTVEKLNAKHLK